MEAKPIKCGTGDVFNFKVVKAKEKSHPAEKPIDLLKHILKNHNENEVVLDCFMGTGSIGQACKDLNMKYIGIEIEPFYFETSQKRLI